MSSFTSPRFSRKNFPLLFSLTLCRYFLTTPVFYSASRRPGTGGLGKRKDPEAELYDIEKMPEYKFDAITKPGFDILLSQREVRDYLRKTKFELPQLSSKLSFILQW